ncbi:MAG: hypothetical protein A2527_09650 [Candidatus Lambdaproteobacteria bacterium RIFOXYD2_FULL_50_16]|uniref:Cytochrome c domain-containing protein n=1 Tax=Candidatus Lambdaproteobacteria bacterium RIFOXYD2_FULL_50_16 TaxID=1817772 RepID=A0A1F6G7L4_9PROT|nr:MAG: hypothetical protein A2527_09650 [Candidatus Lambdaproteobacteria bacterium RIFOXYD2_FULL_50_16]
MNLKSFTRIALGAIGALLMVGCAGKTHQTNKDKAYDPPPPAESLARGQALFEEYCVTCHGVKGKGSLEQPAAADLTLAATHFTTRGLTVIIDKPHYSAETIKLQVTQGGKQMPSLQDKFSAAQLEDLTNWVKKLIYDPE